MLQLVSHTISNKVTNEIITSTGGDLLQGETGSKLRNSPGSSCSWSLQKQNHCFYGDSNVVFGSLSVL